MCLDQGLDTLERRNWAHRKLQSLLPIAGVPVIIQNAPAGVQATLPGPCCHRSCLCPPSLYALTVCPSGPPCVRKVEVKLAVWTVSRKVEFWNDDVPVFESGQIERGKSFVAVQTLLEILVPLTHNVI